jgi:hypothetical protein
MKTLDVTILKKEINFGSQMLSIMVRKAWKIRRVLIMVDRNQRNIIQKS